MQGLKGTFGRLAVVAAAIAFLVIEAAPRVKYLGTQAAAVRREIVMQVLKVTFGRLAVVAAAVAYLVIEAAPRVRF